jgi:hypothetical protein
MEGGGGVQGLSLPGKGIGGGGRGSAWRGRGGGTAPILVIMARMPMPG